MGRRIRSIKPEILDDAVTAALPHLEWRLFVSLWLLADDYGNLHGEAAQIKGAALWKTPDTEAKVREALARLSRDSLVRLYTVRGQAYIHICGWTKHQKVDHPGKAVIPGPAQAESNTCDVSRESRETVANPRETLAPDQDQDQDQERESATPGPLVLLPTEPKSDPVEVAAVALLTVINTRGGYPRGYRPVADVLKDTRANLRKHPLDDQLMAVNFKFDEWLGNDRMRDQLKPSVLLRPSNMSRYVEEAKAGKPTPRNGASQAQEYVP